VGLFLIARAARKPLIASLIFEIVSLPDQCPDGGRVSASMVSAQGINEKIAHLFVNLQQGERVAIFVEMQAFERGYDICGGHVRIDAFEAIP
jgi:hypothetical protein